MLTQVVSFVSSNRCGPDAKIRAITDDGQRRSLSSNLIFRLQPAKMSSSVNARNPLPVKDALLGWAAQVGAHRRPKHHECALMADLAHLFGTHVGRVGAGIDTRDEPLAVECVGAGVGIVLADMTSGHL